MDHLLNKTNQSTAEKHVSAMLFGGLLLHFLLEYIRPGSNFFPVIDALKINTLIPVAVFALTFLSGSGRTQSEILTAPSTKWFLFFIAIFPLQVLTADVTLYVYERFKDIVGSLLIYYIIIKQVTKIERIRAIACVLLFIHIFLIFINPDVVLQPENRNYLIGGPFLGDGNDFSWSVCIIIPFALFLAQSSDSKLKKIFFYGMFMLLVLAVIATQSRGGSLAMGASIIYLVARGKRKALGLMGMGVLVAVVFLFAPQAYYERMSSIADYETEGSAQGRIMAWNSAVRMAMDHPVTGVGAGHFGVKFGVEYRPPGVGRTEMPWLNAHSIYFLTLGEFGFTGILFLLGLIFTNMIRNERIILNLNKSTGSVRGEQRQLTIAMQASLISFAVGGAFLSGLYYPHIFIVSALNECVCFLALRGAENQDRIAEKMIDIRQQTAVDQTIPIKSPS